MINVGLNIQCTYISDEEVLTFKTFNIFKKQIACETANDEE
jgi:hypothetical protein